MRHSLRHIQQWFLPLFSLSSQDDERVVSALARLERVFQANPSLVRSLSDRSIPVDVRLDWLVQALQLKKSEPLFVSLQLLVERQGFVNWSIFFQEYLRMRKRLGLRHLYTLFSFVPLSTEQKTALHKQLEEQFSFPIIFECVLDPGLGGGFRVESPDGWVLDASVTGRLNRLAHALAL